MSKYFPTSFTDFAFFPSYFHSAPASASFRPLYLMHSSFCISSSRTALAVEHRALTVKPLTVNPSLLSTSSPSR
ncbi:hypothetical protein RJT34_19225 [Clitoria ternatea]|uniref:Uncharacterized protein n=1 Tax=Clitoria ternatea TaxID=43366 RepID=A0AAN9P4E2_CLITE